MKEDKKILEESQTLIVFLDTDDEQEKLFNELAERGYNVKLQNSSKPSNSK